MCLIIGVSAPNHHPVQGVMQGLYLSVFLFSKVLLCCVNYFADQAKFNLTQNNCIFSLVKNG